MKAAFVHHKTLSLRPMVSVKACTSFCTGYCISDDILMANSPGGNAVSFYGGGDSHGVIVYRRKVNMVLSCVKPQVSAKGTFCLRKKLGRVKAFASSVAEASSYQLP